VRHHPELAEGDAISGSDVTSRDAYIAQAFTTEESEPREPEPNGAAIPPTD
jgi:hypothetical protein